MNAQANAIQSQGTASPATEQQVKNAFEATVNWTKYDGALVQGTTSAPVYLILNGQLCLIPDYSTYQTLFVSGAVQFSDYLVDNVPPGPALTSGAVLAKGPAAATYLVSNGTKQWIPSPDVLSLFNFNASNVVAVPQVVIDFIPQGPNVG